MRREDENIKPRILHLIDHYGFGGAQVLIKGIFEAQKGSNDIFAFSLRKKSDKEVEINHKNFIVSDRKLNIIRSFKDIVDIVNKNKITVLHCHLLNSQIFGLLIKSFFKKDIKLIFHEHGRIFRKNFLYSIFLSIVKRKVDLFIAVSKATRKEFIKQAGIKKEKIRVMYNFININQDLNEFNIEAIKRTYKLDNSYVIGFVGRLDRIKGCDILIKAFSKLLFDAKLLIIGDGNEKNNLMRDVNALNIQKKVIFCGYQKNIIPYIKQMNCLIVPSRSESFGVACLEGQIMGVPVIVSRVGGLTEIVEDQYNGLVFNKNDHLDLANKIIALKKDSELRIKLAKNGLQTVNKYSLSNYLKKLEAIYNGQEGPGRVQ